MRLEEVILFQIDKTSRISKLYSQRAFDQLGMGITVEQWILLVMIQEHDGLTQRVLAEKSLRDPASITRTLDLLSKKNLVERKPVEQDRRQYSISLKKEGALFIEKYMPIVKAHRAKSVEGFSEEDLRELEQLLKKIQLNMQ